jgi:uncharacterized membrane protein (UPF0127 family)
MARVLILLTLFVGGFAARASSSLDKTYEKVRFRIGKTVLQAYIADDSAKREKGLMYIEHLPADTGMLFVFEDERPLAFWMKNTLIPLSIAFADADARIVDIQEMAVAGSLMSVEVPTYRSAAPAQFALEMNKGWYARHKIRTGQRLELLSGVKSVLIKQNTHMVGKSATRR